MMTVLIVEDEVLARVGLRKLLDWESLGFSLLPDARDGEEAIQMIHRKEPDIILLDLNIPKVNGLQILEYLKNKNIKSKVIIVSCNEEFAMVKKAMKLGAYDYLRKLNLSSEELLGIILRCKNEAEMAESKKPFRNEFSFHEIRYEEIMGGGRDIFINAKSFRTIVCILPQEAENYTYGIVQVIRSYLEENKEQFIQIIKGSFNFYFLIENLAEESFFLDLHTRLKTAYEKKVYMGIHYTVMENVQEIHQGLALAEQIAVYSYYDDPKEIYTIGQKISLQEHMPKEMNTLLTKLNHSVADFAVQESETILALIFNEIRSVKYIHLNVLRRFFMDILGIYSMTAQSLGGAIEEIEIRKDNCHYQKIMSMGSLRQIQEWFLEFARAFYDCFCVSFKCSRIPILKEAFLYIENHLSEQIHLSQAARDIGCSSAYLSTVFKKEIGQNFIEYVNMRKVEMAKEMLEQGKKVYEVSDTLGFENSTYFSKVFKKYTGFSPDSYKKQMESIMHSNV